MKRSQAQNQRTARQENVSLKNVFALLAEEKLANKKFASRVFARVFICLVYAGNYSNVKSVFHLRTCSQMFGQKSSHLPLRVCRLSCCCFLQQIEFRNCRLRHIIVLAFTQQRSRSKVGHYGRK